MLIDNQEIKAIVHNEEIYIPITAVKYLGANLIETNDGILIQKQPTDLKTAYEMMKNLEQSLTQIVNEYKTKLPQTQTQQGLKQLALDTANKVYIKMQDIEKIIPGNFNVMLAKNSLHGMYNQIFASLLYQGIATEGDKQARELLQRYNNSQSAGLQLSEALYKAAIRTIEKQLQQEGKIQTQGN